MSFGGWSISRELYDWLCENIPPGKTILELGSGAGTEELVKRWKVYSVEHDPDYIGKVPESNYIHAPIVNGWYEYGWVEDFQYHCLIVDGPPAALGRQNFIKRMGLFNEEVPWVFDDMHRMSDLRAAAKVASVRGTNLELHRCADGKEFGVIAANR